MTCVATVLSAVRRVATELDPDSGGTLEIYDMRQLQAYDRIRRWFYDQILQLSEECRVWRQWLLPVNAFTPEVFYYRLMLPQLDRASLSSP